VASGWASHQARPASDQAHEAVQLLLPAEAGVGRHVGDRGAPRHLGQHLLDEVPGSYEVDEHHIEVGEGRAGQAGAVEERVQRGLDPRRRLLDRRLVAQVDAQVLRHLDGRRLDVDGGHVSADVDQDPGGRLAHPRRGSRDQHPPSLVAQDIVHVIPSWFR
jgi:hypothetical protein